MAYYTALISAWNTSSASPGALPSGVAGTSLNGLTTAQKIASVNLWTVTATIPTTINITPAAMLNCINYAEYVTAQTANASGMAQLLSAINACAGGTILGGSANAGLLIPGLFLAVFTNHSGPSVAALSALAGAALWWTTTVANGGGGLAGPVSSNDTAAAGLS